MKSYIFISTFFLVTMLWGQGDSTLFHRKASDSTKQLNMDAVYNRPFLQFGKNPVAVGGYVEGNYQYAVTEGKTEGHQFQARRFTLFLASGIGRRLKFLAELELEDAAKEINIEFASIDLEIHPLLNWRNGIIMNPIGAFNQNHDGPKWEFTDRPLSAEQLLPATWSNAGTGIYGKSFRGAWMFGYELYLSGGFDEFIIDNEQGKTYLPASKMTKNRFEAIHSGIPWFSGKLALRHRKLGELGLSYMRGVYNRFREEGIAMDTKKHLQIAAIDYNLTLKKWGTNFIAEYAWIKLELPDQYLQTFGSEQMGAYLDIIQPVVKRKIGSWSQAVINVALRCEYVDWNRDFFKETGAQIGDHFWSVMPAISFRPTPLTVFRLNYRIARQTDFLNNPALRSAALTIGFSSYF